MDNVLYNGILKYEKCYLMSLNNIPIIIVFNKC